MQNAILFALLACDVKDNYFHFFNKKQLPDEFPTAALLLILVCYVRHKCKMSCALDSNSKCSLMLCTVSGDSSGKDFSSFGNVSF